MQRISPPLGGVPEEPAPLRRGRWGITPESDLLKCDPVQNTPLGLRPLPPEGGENLLCYRISLPSPGRWREAPEGFSSHPQIQLK